MSLNILLAVEELVMACSRRILIVDDDAYSAELLSEILESMGQQTCVVLDAPLALTSAVEFLPHIAILDLDMPRLNGFDLAEAIRRHEELRNIGIFALSGWNDSPTKIRCRQRGFDRFFAKPVPIDQICFALIDYC